MKQTAVEWLADEIFRRYKFTFQQLNCQPLEEAIQQAKEMEKEQQSYSEEEVNKMFDTLKINSVDNVATIHNVELFISSWKRELKKK